MTKMRSYAVLPRALLPRALLLGALLLSGCDSLGLSGTVEVRIQNVSSLLFTTVSFYAGDELQTYHDIRAGQGTPYVEAVQDAYPITTAEVVVEGDTVRLQVIDHVGEEPLSGGRYTYMLTVDGPPGSRSLRQQLREDS